MPPVTVRFVDTPTLRIAVEEHGPADGDPVVLLHGFPYAPDGYAAVADALAREGRRVVVPFLRGYGPTRFRHDGMRSGQQAAVGADLRDLLDAMALERPVLAGYDWGGRAACIVAALWPERVRGLVSGEGYAIQNIAASVEPLSPEMERRLWYQYYFHTPRGEAGLQADRRGMAKLLWQLWSPTWRFDDATFERSAAAFDNPDFVPVVIHSYRHRFGYAPGDPALAELEAALAAQPAITVPSVALYGADDGVASPRKWESGTKGFAGPVRIEVIEGAGHNLPQEAPDAFVRAILSVS